jgi:hypothetical protein
MGAHARKFVYIKAHGLATGSLTEQIYYLHSLSPGALQLAQKRLVSKINLIAVHWLPRPRF